MLLSNIFSTVCTKSGIHKSDRIAGGHLPADYFLAASLINSRLSRRLTILRFGLLLILVIAAWPAKAQGIDPALVGTWKLNWAGPAIYWQVREDGIYRSFGVGARPNEHWGTMTASQGQFASKSAIGEDGGSYSVKDNVWTTAGKLGTGSWTRVWGPGMAGSVGTCRLVDSALVESVLGTHFTLRERGEGCEFSSTIAGSGELTIAVTRPQGFAPTSFAGSRRRGSGNKIDVPGVGEGAYINGSSIRVLRGSAIIIVTRALRPATPDSDTADLVKLGRAVAQRL